MATQCFKKFTWVNIDNSSPLKFGFSAKIHVYMDRHNYFLLLHAFSILCLQSLFHPVFRGPFVSYTILALIIISFNRLNKFCRFAYV